ncbi:Uncharacterised protein [Mycolicibacterium aurum]|uniref:Secreted protein n=1 Tax=Mycolicibacterium aurum TaxID=1791 RepID=A0A3S4RMS3_MYCAU|nr:hypothetical protein [Mycolicibacterium aurum]VEG51684.1 Uncharacterised protein [Mycolicibacterium aurum]
MVPSRIVVSAACAAVLGALSVPGLAAAQPPPPPPPPPAPDVNAYAPANPKDFAIYDGAAYAFTTGGLLCTLQRSGGYGCNGVLPGAPRGANVVGGFAGGVPGFSASSAPIYGGPANALPPNTRLSFGTVSCGGDGTVTACVDGSNQSGFVVTPSASWIVNVVNPLLARPEGTNPFMN